MDTYQLETPSASAVSSDSGAIHPSERYVCNALLHIGVPTHQLGYRFLRQAILIGLDHPESLQHVSRNLYPVIALQCGTSTSRVERAIRHAIDTAWGRGAPEALNKMLGCRYLTPVEKPSNCEFMSLITEWVRLRTTVK